MEQDKAANEREITKLQKICDILSKPSKYDMCVACLPCLGGDAKLEDAKFKCVTGSCERCGFDKLWKHGVCARIFLHEYDARKGEWVDKLNPNSKLATDSWLETVEWRNYVYKTKPTLAAHAIEVARQATAARAPLENDLDYEPTKNASARNLVLETMRGTVVDYLDHFERKMVMHIEHRNLVSLEHRSKLQYARNSRPLAVARDIDFAENGTIENFDKVQSEHWITKQYTLFMSVSSFLEVDKWNDEDGKLEIGSEVTVNGERYVGNEQEKTPININSYWAKVAKLAGEDVCEVEDADGKMHEVHRSTMRLCHCHIICCGHVTDDKLHDRFAMKQFTDKELDYLEGYMKDSFPNNLINGSIKRLHQHSDNASQHFKSTGSLEYFSSLIRDRGGPTECAYVYSFGAPGHGKGVFDGVGGAIKNKVHSLIKATKTTNEGVPGVESVYINDVKDVFQAISHHFENSDNHVRKKAGGNPIDHFKFFLYLLCDNNPIQQLVEEFHQLIGISSNYQFAVNNVGCVYMRKRSCWCPACLSKLMQSTLTWGETCSIGNCISRQNETTTIYDFGKQSCRKQRGIGVGAMMHTIRQTRDEMVQNITHGDWVMFQSPEPNVQPFWIGRVVSKEEWSNACIYKNEATRRFALGGGVRLDRGKYAINVQWYTVRDAGCPLEYFVDGAHPYPFVNNYSTLVMTGFEMVQTVGVSVRVPRQRTVRVRDDELGYAQPQYNLQTRAGDWFRSEFGNIYRMNDETRQVGIARCRLWGQS